MTSKTFIAKTKDTSKTVIEKLNLDPYQRRTSLNPIILTHPRTNRTGYLAEYVEEIDEGSRFAIECSDAELIFISRMYNSSFGHIFLAVGRGRFRDDRKI